MAVGYWFPTDNSDGSSAGMVTSADDIIAGINGAIDQLNLGNNESITAAVAQLKQDAMDLTALKVDGKYVAGSSSLGSVDDLVAAIASHYGFKPTTGEDL